MSANSKNSPARGGLSRRQFGTQVMGATAAGLILPNLSATAARAATPKKGGILRLAVSEGHTNDSLNPARTGSGTKAILSFQFRNGLVELAPNGELIGELSDSWETSADAKTWTFKVRKGVTFHSGKTLDATDVVESYNHHRHPDAKSPGKRMFSTVADLQAPDAETVVFTLTEGNLDFPYILTSNFFPICRAKAGGGIEWETGDGTGPYIMEEFKPGVSARTRRNPNYWKEGRGHFDGIDTTYVTDPTARFNGLRTGSFDLIMDPDPKTLNLVERMPGVNVLSVKGARHAVMPMLSDMEPFANNDVRMALKLAIDR